MKTKNEVQFDELDLKCLKEMPLILDVMAATGNKIRELLIDIHSEMNEFIMDDLKLKSKWSEGKNYCLATPLTDAYIMSKFSVESFEQVLYIENATEYCKEIRGKKVNSFWVSFAYECNNTEEPETINNFYFYITRMEDMVRDENINKLKFYNQIKSKLEEFKTDYSIQIHHPEKNDEEWEEIKLIVNDLSMDKIQGGLSLFKKSILIPFLKTIE